LVWKPTPEWIAALPLEQLKVVRENAIRSNAQEVVELCDAELARRKPEKAKAHKVSSGKNGDRTIHGIHFVCPIEKDVEEHPDGTISTGIWVVDKDRLDDAMKVGAYVALHEARSKLSYGQGIIKGWRVRERQGAKTRFGIEFDLEPTEKPLQWRGDATGEKGYFYGDE
jgi:hypothetical protein